MSDLPPSLNPADYTLLDEYPRVPRGPPPQPTLLGILSGFPAIQYALADILGYQVVNTATDLLAGSWYYLDASGGAFGVTLPAGGGLYPGDSIGILTGPEAVTKSPVIYTSGGDLLMAGGQEGQSLICNVASDRFRLTWATGVWQAC
jgi:hypothetical protein